MNINDRETAPWPRTGPGADWQFGDLGADTSIAASALPFASTQGNNVGIYMTESGCPNQTRFANYDRLSGNETDHSRNVGAIIRAVSPSAVLYCRGGAVLPTSVDLYADLLNSLFGYDRFPVLDPPIRIVTRSDTSVSDNTVYSTLDHDWDNFVYETGIPAFSWVDPDTGNQKPELSAPGTNITAGGFTMSGTSMAAPHAAAFTADMMSSRADLRGRPHLVKANLLAGATDPVAGGYGLLLSIPWRPLRPLAR